MNDTDPLNPALPADTAAQAGFPWPPAEHESILTAYTDTWRGACLAPAAFFRALPDRLALGSALLYYLPLGIAVAGATLFWTVVRGVPEEAALPASVDALGGMSPVVEFLMSPLILLFSLFVSAGVAHLMLKLLGGAHRDVGTSVRVFAFAYSPQILGIVPYIGQFAGFVWMVVIGIIGLREAHRTSTGKAAAAVLVPLTIALIFVGIAMFIVATTSVLTA